MYIQYFRNLIFYFAVGGTAALANLASRVAYNWWMNFSCAVVCAFFTGMLVNFFLSSKFVFAKYEGSSTSRVISKFALVAIVGLSVTWLTSVVTLQFLQWLSWLNPVHAEFIAHVTGTGTAFFVSFLGHQFFTYRHTGIVENMARRLLCK